jgi:hydrogenase nickel incorporation protein HypA/HybF
MSIAGAVMEAVEAESQKRGGAKVRKIGLKVGELSGVEPESLRFCFEVLAAEIELDLQFCPWTNRCGECGRIFPVVDYQLDCPGCGSPRTEPSGGSELELNYLELEEP